MQENIETKNIGNRKFIIELRFDPKVSMLDKKGLLAEQIENCKAFNINHWEIGQSEVSIRDHEDKEKATNIVAVTFNRLSFISFKINSIEGFYSTFKKIYEAVINVLGELNIRRIGCRIIGTYMVKSKDYNSVLNNFKASFPAKFLIDQYPAKDFLFNFKKHIGVVIDTDNYLTNETQNINAKSLIKDIYTLSLSVEKNLYSNLAEF